jgi:hypothetical protein
MKQLDKQLDRKSVREHERLGYAIAAPGEHFQRPAAGGGLRLRFGIGGEINAPIAGPLSGATRKKNICSV